jgi:hypothetical protein
MRRKMSNEKGSDGEDSGGLREITTSSSASSLSRFDATDAMPRGKNGGNAKVVGPPVLVIEHFLILFSSVLMCDMGVRAWHRSDSSREFFFFFSQMKRRCNERIHITCGAFDSNDIHTFAEIRAVIPPPEERDNECVGWEEFGGVEGG